MDSAQVDTALILGIKLVVHGKWPSSDQSGNLFDDTLDIGLRLTSALLQGAQRPVSELLEALVQSIEQILLRYADKLLGLLLLRRLAATTGGCEGVEGLSSVHGSVSQAIDADGVVCLALGSEHLLEAEIRQTAVFGILNGGQGDLVGDVASQSDLFYRACQYRV